MPLQTVSEAGAAIRGVGVTFREFFTHRDFSEVSGWGEVGIKTMNTDEAVSTFSGKTGAGFLVRTPDGSVMSTGSRFKLFDTSVSQDPYTLRLEVTRQQMLYRDFSEVFDEAADLMDAFKSTLSRAGAQIFNRAFTSGDGVTGGTRVVQYADGSPLASTSHPRADGGTAQSNASSTSIPLTESNVETGRIALLLQLQDDGKPLANPGPLKLVVGVNNEKTAQIITRSEKRSGTANNDLNIYSGGAMDVVSSSWLDSGISGSGVGSNTQWFLTAPRWVKAAIILSGGPDFDFLVDKNTKSRIFDIIVDLGVVTYDFRGFYCSQGNNASYTS